MVIAITGLTGFLDYFLAKRFSNMKNIKMKALARKTSNLMFLEEFQDKISFVVSLN